jgi:hypothetical protein
MNLRGLPTAQELQRHEPNAIKSLLDVVGELQQKAALLDDLVNAGIVRVDVRGNVYNPNSDDKALFSDPINVRPDAPTGLAAKTTSNLAFLSWTIPPFQPALESAEVWELAAPIFNDSVNYEVGEFVTYNGIVYVFTSTHPAGAWNASHVEVADSSDLVIGNANNRHSTQISTAIVPLDVNGGTSYFWVRLVSQAGTAGLFSSSIGVQAQSKELDGGNVAVVSIYKNTNESVSSTSTIVLSSSDTTREIDDAPSAVTLTGGGEVTISDSEGFTQFRLTGFASVYTSTNGRHVLYWSRNGVGAHSRCIGDSFSCVGSGYYKMTFITPWIPISSGGEVILLMLIVQGTATLIATQGTGLQVELR